MKFLRLFGMLFSLSLRREMAFRGNLLFQLLLTALRIFSEFAVLGVLYTQTQTLAGWNLGESIVLLGTFQIVSGIDSACIEPNLSWFAGQVKEGKLDSVLVQPVSSIFMVSLGKNNPLMLAQALMGLIVVGLGLDALGTLPAFWSVLGWLVLIAVGLVIAWAGRILLASIVFWAPSIELDVLYSALWQFGRYPVSIYQQPLRFMLIYVLPFAFLATFPASALTGRSGPLLPIVGMGAALLAGLLVHLVWQTSLRRYTSATS